MATVWKSGISSASLGIDGKPARVEWIYCDEQYPTGRYTLDPAQALVWAEQAAEIANGDANSGATDYEPAVWQEDIE